MMKSAEKVVLLLRLKVAQPYFNTVIMAKKKVNDKSVLRRYSLPTLSPALG